MKTLTAEQIDATVRQALDQDRDVDRCLADLADDAADSIGFGAYDYVLAQRDAS